MEIQPRHGTKASPGLEQGRTYQDNPRHAPQGADRREGDSQAGPARKGTPGLLPGSQTPQQMTRAEFCQLLDAYANAAMTVALAQERHARPRDLHQALGEAANARRMLECSVFNALERTEGAPHHETTDS